MYERQRQVHAQKSLMKLSASEKVSIVVNVDVSSDSICSLSDVFFFFLISWLASSDTRERDGVCTQNTSLHARNRTFLS